MECVIDDSLVNNDQPIVINNEDPCTEFSKSEDITPLDDRDDKSSDTNSCSSCIAEENGIGR